MPTGGRPRTSIARELKISSEHCGRGLKQADVDAGLRHDDLTTEERPRCVSCVASSRIRGRHG